MIKLPLCVGFCALALGVGCGNETGDSNASSPFYPACSGAVGQCLDHFDVGQGLTLPVFRNVSLTAQNTEITQAIVVIQGFHRTANEYFSTVAAAAEQAGRDTTTLVAAPHFECSDDTVSSGDVTWKCSGDDWTHGYADTSGAKSPIYSYAVMDELVQALANKDNFPDLTRIVITGLSGGGQFTQRYAAFNALDPLTGVTMEYLVLSPSSYVYLDANRLPSSDSCFVDGGCIGAFAPFAGASDCSDYDQYPYGLENRSGYVGSAASSDVQARYVARDLRYMVGDQDTLENSPGTDLDTSCGANAQGVDRVARAINFWSDVHQNDGATHPLTLVAGCTHSESCMYFSPEGRADLFP